MCRVLADARRDPIGTRGFPSHLDEFFEFLLESHGRRLILVRLLDELSLVVCDRNVVEMDFSNDARHRGMLWDPDFVECGNHPPSTIGMEAVQPSLGAMF